MDNVVIDPSLIEVLAFSASFMIALIGSVWSLAWWLSGRFGKIYDKIDKVSETISNKLEYHEKHDDERFTQIRNDIWDMRIKEAAAAKLIIPEASMIEVRPTLKEDS